MGQDELDVYEGLQVVCKTKFTEKQLQRKIEKIVAKWEKEADDEDRCADWCYNDIFEVLKENKDIELVDTDDEFYLYA